MRSNRGERSLMHQQKMTSKRRKSQNSYGISQNSKRARQADRTFGDKELEGDQDLEGQASAGPLDPDYGQRGAFPGLDDSRGEEEQLFYGPASDGLEYLRMVRSEAKQVPKVLVVPPAERGQVSYNERDNEHRGWYADGAYTAAPEDVEDVDDNLDSYHEDDGSEPDTEPQDAYYSALVARFLRLRETLSAKPPRLHGMASKTHGRIQALYQYAKRAQWSYELRATAPKAQDIVSSSQDDIIRGISRLNALLTKSNLLNQGPESRLSVWSWGLLAACRDVGEMSSEEVSVLRDFGKTALVVAYRIRTGLVEDMTPAGEEDTPGMDDEEASNVASGDEDRPQVPTKGDILPPVAQHPSTDEEEVEGSRVDGGKMSSVDELERSRIALLVRLSSEAEEIDSEVASTQKVATSDHEPAQRALAALDMIVTVVGEVFGQRDLLDRRAIWK